MTPRETGATSVEGLLDRLAEVQPADIPVVSLYLDTRPDQHGRDHFDTFLRKELSARVRAHVPRSAQRQSLEEDAAASTPTWRATSGPRPTGWRSSRVRARAPCSKPSSSRRLSSATTSSQGAAARQTAARVRVIREALLLAEAEGVGALLRYGSEPR